MTTEALVFNRDLLGKEFPAGTFTVKKEEIIAYCQSVGETNPIHTDERAAKSAGHASVVAPFGFCNLLARGGSRPNIELKFSGTDMHGGQSVELLGTIVAGDVLRATTSLKTVYAKTGRTGTMVFTVWQTTFYNQKETPVCKVDASMVRRPRVA